MSHFIDSSTLGGVECKIATIKAKDFHNSSADTFMDLYGRGANCMETNRTRRDLNAKGLGALGLRTSKPDGATSDFSKNTDRNIARDLVQRNESDYHELTAIHGLLCLKPSFELP